jgi:hypothetical protein
LRRLYHNGGGVPSLYDVATSVVTYTRRYHVMLMLVVILVWSGTCHNNSPLRSSGGIDTIWLPYISHGYDNVTGPSSWGSLVSLTGVTMIIASIGVLLLINGIITLVIGVPGYIIHTIAKRCCHCNGTGVIYGICGMAIVSMTIMVLYNDQWYSWYESWYAAPSLILPVGILMCMAIGRMCALWINDALSLSLSCTRSPTTARTHFNDNDTSIFVISQWLLPLVLSLLGISSRLSSSCALYGPIASIGGAGLDRLTLHEYSFLLIWCSIMMTSSGYMASERLLRIRLIIVIAIRCIVGLLLVMSSSYTSLLPLSHTCIILSIAIAIGPHLHPRAITTLHDHQS